MENEIKDIRNYPVKKSNIIIQNTICILKAQEFDILQYLIMKIKDDDDEIKPQIFSISEFCKVANIKAAGNNYNSVKDSLKALADKSVWVKFPDSKKEQLVRWIEDPFITEDGEITVQLKKIWEPYLLDLKKRYTVTTLKETLPMKSVYSKRLYELLMSYTINNDLNLVEFSIEELKRFLLGEAWEHKYKEFKHFNSKVIKAALREIDKFGNIHVKIEYRKKGRSVKFIKFKTEKKDVDSVINTYENRKKYFDN